MKKLINVNIKDELTKNRDKSIDNANMSANVHEVKKLLAGREIKEREVLKEAGLDHNLKQVEEVLGINLERERFEERIGENVFTEDEIKSISLKYNLKFLQSKRYKGSIEPQLGAKILRFFEEKKIDSINYEANNNLYILAPATAFNLDERPLPPKPARIDPAIFYKMTGPREVGTYYVMIHKWGNDFTVARRIMGVILEHKWRWASLFMLSVATVILSIIAMFGFNPFLPVPMIFSGIVAFLTLLIGWGTRMGITVDGSTDRAKSDKFNLRFSRHGWNSHEI